MIASLVLVAVLNSAANSRCSETFNALFAMSARRADEREYAEAAALREGAAHVYDSCSHQTDEPRHGLFPFDGVGAYAVAAMFWHLSRNDDQATRNLGLAKAALDALRRSYPRRSMDDVYRLHLNKIEQVIRNEENGHWGVWKE